MSRRVDVKALVSHIIRGDGSDKCRICMGDTSEGQVYLGDTVMMDGDRAVTLSELLESITGVEVGEASILPGAICGACKATLNAALPFIKLCKESSKRWDETTEFLIKYSVPENTKNLYVIIKENSIKTVIDKTKYSIPPARNVKDVLRNFKTRLNRLRAAKKRHLKTRSALKNDQDCFKCPECQALYTNFIYFNRHVRDLGMKACVQCKEVFRTDSLKKHLRKAHGIDAISCNTCHETFESRILLNKHVKLYHNKGSHFCIHCKRSFLTYKCFAGHVHVHSSQTCVGCNKRFTNKPCFKKHACANRAVKTEKCICDYCSEEFNSKHTLQVHIVRQHLVGKRHQCEICGKKFQNRIALSEHDNTHNRVEDRYVCSICDARYSTRRGYQRHVKKHEYPEKYRSDRRRKTHECSLCDFRSQNKASLDEHLKSKHDAADWDLSQASNFEILIVQ